MFSTIHHLYVYGGYYEIPKNEISKKIEIWNKLTFRPSTRTAEVTTKEIRRPSEKLKSKSKNENWK